MTAYSDQTVANLRQLLKERGIPSTGLTRKAQIVERLEEWDQTNNEESEAEREVEGSRAATPPEGSLPDAASVAAAVQAVPSDEPKVEGEATGPSQTESGTDQPELSASEPIGDEHEKSLASTKSEQASTAIPKSTPSPAPDEKQSIEKAEMPSIPERSATTTAEPSRLNTEELEAENKKRKRRSQTPELSTQEVRAKKPRPSDDPVHKTILAKDDDIVMDQRQPEETEAMEAEPINGHSKAEEKVIELADAVSTDNIEASSPGQEHDLLPEKKGKAPRYRELLKPVEDTLSTHPDTPSNDRPVSPALHPVTSALYIRNFMRPLRPEHLRAHLNSLASPPSSTPDSSMIKLLFLDPMKTHAFVLFANTNAASRVRATLHGTIWPPEGNRKDLWVDFIPEEQCKMWISEEEETLAAEKEARASGRPIPAKRFEVVFPEDVDGVVTAVFQEVGTGSVSTFNPPKGPRLPGYQAPLPQGVAPVMEPTEETREDIAKSFKTLDELFDSTTAKPKLYFLPVSDERYADRLNDLQAETSRNWTPEERRKGRGMQSHGPLDVKLRYTFDKEDRVVEAGTDFGPWAKDYRSGGFRGGRGGGFRGRSGRVGGWRSGP